eukprot:1930171-Amphidinium_carterae.2
MSAASSSVQLMHIHLCAYNVVAFAQHLWGHEQLQLRWSDLRAGTTPNSSIKHPTESRICCTSCISTTAGLCVAMCSATARARSMVSLVRLSKATRCLGNVWLWGRLFRPRVPRSSII